MSSQKEKKSRDQPRKRLRDEIEKESPSDNVPMKSDEELPKKKKAKVDAVTEDQVEKKVESEKKDKKSKKDTKMADTQDSAQVESPVERAVDVKDKEKKSKKDKKAKTEDENVEMNDVDPKKQEDTTTQASTAKKGKKDKKDKKEKKGKEQEAEEKALIPTQITEEQKQKLEKKKKAEGEEFKIKPTDPPLATQAVRRSVRTAAAEYAEKFVMGEVQFGNDWGLKAVEIGDIEGYDELNDEEKAKVGPQCVYI